MGIYRFANWGISKSAMLMRFGTDMTIVGVSNVPTIDVEGPAWTVSEMTQGLNNFEYLGEVVDGVLVPPTPPGE